LTRCRHCGIFFLTHPRNAGRRDLRCPFGCREAHRKEISNKRSIEWYRSKKGKKKKKEINRRRFLQILPSNNKNEELNNKESCEQQEQVILDEPEVSRSKTILSYLQMLISLIEGRKVSIDEILQMLLKIVRQHSIDRRRRFLYAFTYPVQRPP